MAGYIGSKSSVVLNAGATAAQGALADTAVQPNDNVTLGVVTATSFSGDGSGLTNLPSSAPTTADVLSATAGASVGAVGTYAFMLDTGAGTRVEGTLRSGSVLKYSNSYTITVTNESGGRNSSPAGTWMLMGAVGYYQIGLSYYSASQLRLSNSLWLRIS